MPPDEGTGLVAGGVVGWQMMGRSRDGWLVKEGAVLLAAPLVGEERGWRSSGGAAFVWRMKEQGWFGKPLAGGDGRSRNVWLAKEGAGVMMVPLLGEGRSCSREGGRSRYGWLAKEGAVV